MKLLGLPILTAGSVPTPSDGVGEAAPGANRGEMGGDLLLRMLRLGITGRRPPRGANSSMASLPVHTREVLAAWRRPRRRSEVLDRATRVATLVWINLGAAPRPSFTIAYGIP